MSQGPLCPNLTQNVQREVSQMANRNFSHAMLLGGLSVNLNHLKMTSGVGFFFRNGTVSYHLVTVSYFFKEPRQEPGAKKFRTGYRFGSFT